MTREGNEVEQAVARTVRDSLEKLQRNTEELNQAVNDLVAACASARPSNALPPTLRAQTAAASLSASLEVLARFIAGSLQLSMRTTVEVPEQTAPSSSMPSSIPPSMPVEPRAVPVPVKAPAFAPVPAAANSAPRTVPVSPPIEVAPAPVLAPPSVVPAPPREAVAPTLQPVSASDLAELPSSNEFALPELPAEPEIAAEPTPVSLPVMEVSQAVGGFDILMLSPEEQELHRRANRVAKVSMQDIKLLRPGDVVLGREHKDLCSRLRDDIEKAHKEYDRRFQAILGHPVDYFYDWMVEILGDGNPETLGSYPYPSSVLRH